MLSKRIIPCLDMADGRVVKGVNFEGLRDCGDPVELARRYYLEGADELAFLDISASAQKRGNATKLAREVSRELFIPFMVGGGISSIEDIRAVLGAGADKVSINASAVNTPWLIESAAASYGSQCVVVAIDARRKREGREVAEARSAEMAAFGSNRGSNGMGLGSRGMATGSGWEVMIYGGKKETGLDAIEWAKKVVGLGAGEILLTSIDSDGVRKGYDIDLTRAVAEAVDVPVIASGGAGCLEDFATALSIGGADAALAASLFHNGELSIGEVKAYLKGKGIPVRLGA